MSLRTKDNIYTAPNIIWETDPSKQATDPDIQKLFQTIAGLSFSEALRVELVASRFYYQAMGKLTDERGTAQYPVSLGYAAAFGARWGRSIHSHKYIIVPSNLSEGVDLGPYGIERPKTGHDVVHGYTFLQNFWDVEVSDNAGKFIHNQNILYIDAKVLKTVRDVGCQDLMDRLLAIFQKTVHDHLHLATDTLASNHLHTRNPDSLMFQRGSPESIARFKAGFIGTWDLGKQKLYRSQYETWANVAHRIVINKILGEEGRIRVIADARDYVQRVGQFKAKLIEKSGSNLDMADRMATYLLAIYFSPLEIIFDTHDKNFQSLDEDIRRLKLPAIQPSLERIVTSMRDYRIDPRKEHYKIAASAIRHLKLDCNDPILTMLAMGILEHNKLGDHTYLGPDAIADFLDHYAEQKLANDASSALSDPEIRFPMAIEVTCGLFTENRPTTNYFAGSKYKFDLLRTPEGQNIWLDMLKTCSQDKIPLADKDTISFFRAIRDLGILSAPSAAEMPDLEGLDAIRYICLTSINGMYEALHDNGLLKKGNPEEAFQGFCRSDSRATLIHALDWIGEASDAVIKAGKPADIGFRKLVLQDMAGATQYSPAELSIPDSYRTHASTQQQRMKHMILN